MKKIKFPQFIKYTLMVGVVFIAFFGMGIGLVSWLWPDTTISTASSDANTNIEDTKRVNILLLGVDARSGETISRSDTIILASIDPELKRVAMVSIPRDTKISGSSAGGMDKINAANVIGGPELAVSKVEELMGEKIDYYIEVDFKGFKEIIDTVGGVDINVDQKMYKPTEGINLKPGQQRLDGDGALAFVRYRDYINGDIDRTSHQQIFLKALSKELLQPSTIVKLPTLIKEAKANVKTNMGLSTMLKIATWAPGFSTESIVAQTLPGSFLNLRNSAGVLTGSYWVADKTQASTLLDTMLKGQTVAVIVPGSTNVTPTPKVITPTTNKTTTPTTGTTDKNSTGTTGKTSTTTGKTQLDTNKSTQGTSSGTTTKTGTSTTNKTGTTTKKS